MLVLFKKKKNFSKIKINYIQDLPEEKFEFLKTLDLVKGLIFDLENSKLINFGRKNEVSEMGFVRVGKEAIVSLANFTNFCVKKIGINNQNFLN